MLPALTPSLIDSVHIYDAEAITLEEEVRKIEIIKVPTDRELIENEINKYDWNTSIALKVMMGESMGIPTAYNPEWHYDKYGNPICQGSYGPMQLACIHHKENPQDLFGIQLNIELAYKLYSSNGWRPWGVCHDGKVNCNL